MCALIAAHSVCHISSAAPVNANTLSLNSGSTSGTSDVLNNDGYAGTYITVPAGNGDVTVTVNAAGTVAAPATPFT